MKQLMVAVLSTMLALGSVTAMARGGGGGHGGGGHGGGGHGSSFHGGGGFHGGFRGGERGHFGHRGFRGNDVLFGLAAGGLLGYGLASPYDYSYESTYPYYNYPQQCYYYPGTNQVYCPYGNGYDGYAYPYGYSY